MKENLYPCCSAIPAQITLADAPTKVPLPPKQGPNANAQTSGCNGRPSVVFSDKVMTTFTFILTVTKF
jgi:hypothetical protein